MDDEKRTKITKTGREGMMVVMSQMVTRTGSETRMKEC